ncbi:MAG: crotonyl-CoA carboxylase/reductase [Bacteroidetes bacterium]|nr:crotonyl-CoA carboxylase/reductase [Bacteroidota bacterium]
MQLTELGSLPPLNDIPEKMYAQVLRANRYGPPIRAYQMEVVDVPAIADDEVLIGVKAAGLNFNSVWASTGYPMDMIELMHLRKESSDDFMIAGSDCSGIVYKIGRKVTRVKVGDEIVVQAGWYDMEEPFLKNGGDPCFAKSGRAWGYETSWGSFAQFCKVKEVQCLPKPPNISWDEAAVYMLSGATVYRMLFKYPPHVVMPGDVVMIWGGAGGLGSMAIQMVKMAGGIPLAIVNSKDKEAFCKSMGALVINRSDFSHWGALKPGSLMPDTQEIWRNEAKIFFKKVLELTGKRLPRIVLEHPGENTMPTSLYVCDKEGMVVTCAGTTGYLATFDVRYLWLQRKRIQGSHFANNVDCEELNQLVIDGKIKPVLAETVHLSELPQALQKMYDNTHKGNTAIRIGY